MLVIFKISCRCMIMYLFVLVKNGISVSTHAFTVIPSNTKYKYQVKILLNQSRHSYRLSTYIPTGTVHKVCKIENEICII